MAGHSKASSLADDIFSQSLLSQNSSSHISSNSHGSATFPPYLRPPHLGQQPVRKQTSLASIRAPSFAAFRSQASSIPLRHPSSQLAQLAQSPRAASCSFADQASPRLAEPTSRPLSVDSPWPQQLTGLPHDLSPPLTEAIAAKRGDRSSNGFAQPGHERNGSIDSRIVTSGTPSSPDSLSRRSSIPVHTRYAHERLRSHGPRLSTSTLDFSDDTSPFKSGTASKGGLQQAASTAFEVAGVQRTLSEASLNAPELPRSKEQKPKPSGITLGNMFGWKSSSQKAGPDTESPTTTFSDRSPLSPVPSSGLPKPVAPAPLVSTSNATRLAPASLEIRKADANGTHSYDHPASPHLLGPLHIDPHVNELEQELAQISMELAGSIRREMDLEDELDRLRMEIPNLPPSENGRRTSDYYSDSGASSMRFPITDRDGKMDELEQRVRKVEQEKAQIKVENAARMKDELSHRRELEQMIQNLGERLQRRLDTEDEGGDDNDRVTALENSLEETRRRLNQERAAKDQFADLYNVTKVELEQHRSERDNLRDETIPELQARLTGLEAEAADTQALMYENTRMQQELAAYREERGAPSGFTSIAEEGTTSPASASIWGFSRSGSVARSASKRGGSVTRSGSVKDRTEGDRGRSGSTGGQTSQEGVKEIEDQRDALHKALQLMILRHEKQRRSHERAIKNLSNPNRRAEFGTPGKTHYHQEVSFLKFEVTSLRKRTEDALEQKWQYEKGLSGLKMDLDRAEQETKGLRALLQEHDIVAPSPQTLLNGNGKPHKGVEEGLKLSISNIENERDHARQVALQYRQHAAITHGAQATELLESAARMDELADQLEQQVQANVVLQKRLADAVAKGEREQRDSMHQIDDMQKRLAGMEDSVLAAQQHSESTLGNHEAEVRRIEEASTASLQRLRISIPDPKKHALGSPLLARSPRLSGRKLAETSLLEASRTQMLERKVRELEGLLREAEEDMQSVVQRVNRSQMEVADLQTQRDAAMTQMRKLQGIIEVEREKADALMYGGGVMYDLGS